MRLNFLGDLADHADELLVAASYSVVQLSDDHKRLIRYFSAALRNVPARARNVHIAQEFICPPELQSGYDLLIGKVKAGEILRPHLSRKIGRANARDPMLYDWGIQHFHLGTEIGADGLIQGTSFVLFARVSENDFYVIDILEHDNWHRQSLLDRIHNNWPETLELARLKGVERLAFVPNDDDVKELRAANIAAVTQRPDGTVHFSPGLGVSGDGSSTIAVMKTLELVRNTRALEKCVCDQVTAGWGENLRAEYGKPASDDDLQFKLDFSDGRFFIVEQCTGKSSAGGPDPLTPIA